MPGIYDANNEYNAIYYQMPKWLYTLEPYSTLLKSREREAYMMLKDRLAYSIKNNWTDEEGHLYFIFTNEELASILKCSCRTVTSIKNKLVEAGLLIVKKQGFNEITQRNNPSRLYLVEPDLTATDVYQKPSNLQSRGYAKIAPREENNQVAPSLDTKESEKTSFSKNPSSSLQGQGCAKISPYQYNNHLEDTKKRHEDTQLDFSTANFTPAEIEAQNHDLLKHSPEYMTTSDDSLKYIMSANATKLLSMWCRTPGQMYRMVQIILNAKKSIQKELESLHIWQNWQVKCALGLPGQCPDEENTKLDIELNSEDKRDMENTLRKVLNSIRRNADYGKPIKSTENYIFIAFKRHFKQTSIKKLEKLITNELDFERLINWCEK